MDPIKDRSYSPVKVCELCYPNAKEIGEIMPNYWLMENEGKYAIISYNGHRDDEALFFPEKPTPDPDPACVTDDGPIFEASNKWVDTVSDWSETLLLRPEEGYYLCKAAKKAGWESNLFAFWLYDRAGKMLAGELK